MLLTRRAQKVALEGTQTPFIEVNGSGTEASAATLFPAKAKSMSGLCSADHPFLFMIRDLGSLTILFMGRMTNPAATPDGS